MDCLIVVLRRIYSFAMLGEGVSDDLGWVQESEHKNPILGHAWHIFGEGPKAIDNATKARLEVEKALREIGLKPDASFYNLCCSSLMNDTVWSKDVFRLSEAPFNAGTGETIDLSNDEVAESSIIHWSNGRLVPSIGRRDWRGIPACFVPSQPWVIRVMFACSEVDRDNPSFSHKRKFLLPIWDEIQESPTLAFDKTDKVEYKLIAVVRLRDEKLGGNDYVRTYSPYGPNIIPEYEPSTIMSQKWSAESEGKYMLFYGLPPTDLQMTNTNNFPEVAEPELVDEALVEDFTEFMANLRGSETLTQAEEEPSSSVTAVTSSRGQYEGLHEKLSSNVEESLTTHPPSPDSPPPPLEQISRHRGNTARVNLQQQEGKRSADISSSGQRNKKRHRGSYK
ncbi:hypothetical protein FOZG_12253 [Fusarium oxysporum Fo47]|uniref:Uncharacterized protein n=2 Tax=Fusarium oxysporum Fo47 TaxID=660027 RepID=W9JQC5_FUSOX|nr:hypothetical protein FOZG_12253 [Fusarium oxysporum Fo47]